MISADVEGGGAAGGIGLALNAVAKAELRSGAEAFVELTQLERFLEGMDWVVCVEGQMDDGSFEGKLMEHVILRARRAGVRVVAMVGCAQASPPPPRGPDCIVEIGQEPTRDRALTRALLELSDTIRW